jgi:hypothetical protein
MKEQCSAIPIAILAMAAEDERVFSSTGTADRNQLDEDSIEAVKCLRHWYRARKALKRKRVASQLPNPD